MFVVKKVLPVVAGLGIIASAFSHPLSVQALEPSEIYAKAREFTVQIDGEETGTGTIIENNNGTYTVLTCWHVMDTPGSYQIATADGATHQVTKIKNLPDVDLAIITFSSSNAYPVAQLGDSANVTSGFNAYIVGYPDPFPGVPGRNYFTDSAEIQSRLTNAEKGYQIIHSGSFTPGSSGGGIFDREARLVAVNGQFISEGNTGKAYGTGIPLEIYLTAQNNFSVTTNVTAPQDFVSVGKRKLKQKDYSGAIAEFDKALAANPDDIDSLYSRIEANVNLKNYEDMISDLDLIINLNSQDAKAYAVRGISYNELENYKRAIADFDEAIRLNPQDARAYYSRGISHGRLKNYESAIVDFDEAIRLNPQYATAYKDRGIIYSLLEDYESAIADFDEAIRLNPQDARVYYGRGVIYSILKNYESAVADFDEAIRLNPQYATAYKDRGIIYSLLEDYESAIADFDEAIRLNLQDAKVYYTRGVIYGQLKDYESAIADFDEAIRLDSQYVGAYYTRGLTYQLVGNNDFAIKDYEQAAKLYREQGNTDGYQKTIEQIEQLR